MWASFFCPIHKSSTFTRMKTRLFLALFALTATLSSCDGDDKSSDTENKQEAPKQEVNHQEATANIYKELFAELSPDGKDELLLLGIAADSTLSTTVIAAIGNEDKHQELPYIMTPKKDGFWYLQYFRWRHISYEESPFEDNEMVPMDENRQELVAEKSPAALKKKLASKKRYQKDPAPKSVTIGDMGFYLEANTSLIYITNKYISEHQVVSEFQGGAHPMNGDSKYTIPFEQVARHEPNTKLANTLFKSCFGDREWKALAKRLYNKGEKGDFDDLLGDERADGREVDTTEMYMTFERGIGAVHGRFMADAGAAYVESGDYSFTAGELYDKPFCNKVVPVNEIHPSLAELPRKTGCSDFFVSPGQNLVVLLYPNRAEVVDVATGNIRQTIEMRTACVVVMAEWATGDFAKKWWDEVMK